MAPRRGNGYRRRRAIAGSRPQPRCGWMFLRLVPGQRRGATAGWWPESLRGFRTRGSASLPGNLGWNLRFSPLSRSRFEVEGPAVAVGAFYPGVEFVDVGDFHVGAVPHDF